MRGRERGFSVRVFAIVCCAMLLVILPHEVRGDSKGTGEPISAANLPSEGLLKSMPADYFIENMGQLSNQDVRFYTISGEMQIGFAESAVLIKMVEPPTAQMVKSLTDQELLRSPPPEPEPSRGVLLRLNFEGANKVAPHGRDPLPYPTNFFIGSDPSLWWTNVRSYREVVYGGLYDGVDLVYRATDKGVKYDFVLAPGADLGIIRMSYEGANGLELDAIGDMQVHTAIGDIADSSPIAYQGKDDVKCSFVTHAPLSYGFACDGVDESREVVIDPLLYSTYLGGGSDTMGMSIAIDSAGDAYMTGGTYSMDFPVTPGAFDTILGGTSDAFVAKLDSTGSSLVYSTFLGGDSGEYGDSIAIDSAGNAYVTGTTGSADFPVTPGAFDTTFNGVGDVFVAKLDSAGSSLIYSTYLGGGGYDGGYSIAIASAGNAYVTGYAWSTDFPVTLGAFDTTLGGTSDAFVAKLDSTGSSLLYSTFLGGDNGEEGDSIAIDSAGNAYVTGYTESADFPVTPGAFDKTASGISEAFVAKLDSTGSSLIYSTFLGGDNGEEGYSIAIDSVGNAYVTGGTKSTDFPVTPGAFDKTASGTSDAFVVKLDSTGGSLLYSTYLGGGSWEGGCSIVIDSAGNGYVIGNTGSADFPVTTGAFDTTLGGTYDAFVAKFDSTGGSLLYSTYLGGGSGGELGGSIARDVVGNVYVTGRTYSTDFPVTPGAFDTTLGGTSDAFVAKLELVDVNSPPSAFNPGVQGFTSSPGILHVTDITPDLNWTYRDPNGDSQAWCDLRVGTAPGLGDMWDPPATSGPATLVTYGGAPLLKGVDYYFGIKVNDSYSWSPEAEVKFHMNSIPNAPTTPITPAQSSTVPASSSQTVSWTTGGDNESDVITYDWQVSTDSTFASTIKQGIGIGTISASFATNPSTTYFWRVRARDDYEPANWSAFGNTPPGYWTFGTSAANGIPAASNLGAQGYTASPGMVHVTDFTPDLNWTYSDPDGDPQTQYWVRVGTSSGGTDLWNPGQLTGASTAVTYAGVTLQRGVDYFFDVAVYDGLNWSSFAEVLFRLNSIPNPPTMPITPGDAAVIGSNLAQTVSWTSGGDPDVGDIIAFEWQVSTDGAFTTVIASGTTSSTMSSTFATSPSTTYYWRVRAHDDWEILTWSAYGNAPPGYWTFSTSPSQNTPPAITITFPIGGEVFYWGGSPTVTWTSSDAEDPLTALTFWINYTSSAGNGIICGPQLGVLSCNWPLPSITATDVVVNGTVMDSGRLKGYDESGPFTIMPPPNTHPTITITSPTGGEVWTQGSSQMITWTVSDNEDSQAALLVWVNYTSGAGSGNICDPVTCGVGSFSWILPIVTATDVVVNGTVIDTGGLKGYDESGQFTIRAPPTPNTPPTVTITSPTGGEEFVKGSSQIIIWTMHDNEDVNANLTVYINCTTGGITSQVVAALRGQTSFAWTLPSIEANDVVVNITVIDSGGLKGWSQSGPFTIKAPPNTPPTITINYPTGGEVWTHGSSHTVTWTASDSEDATSALFVWINYTSIAGGGNICGPVAGDIGSCAWTLPAITATNVVVNGTVIDTGGLKGYDESGEFTIQPPPNTPPTVTITSPIGGEEFLKGSSHTITWTMHDDQDANANLTVYVNYTTGGVTNQVMAALKGQTSFAWTLPNIEANDVVVNITVIDSGGLKGWSQSGPFTIKAPPSLPSDFLSQYWWLVVVIVAVVIVLLLLALMKRRKPEEEKEEVPPSEPQNPPPSE